MVGPIINESQLKGLVGRIREARNAGTRELVGCEPERRVRPPHCSHVATDQPLACNELFGPVAPLIRAHGDEDALRLANDTEYGLSSAVFTRRVERCVRFAQRLPAGMVHVNDQPVNGLPFNPFAGEKNLGIVASMASGRSRGSPPTSGWRCSTSRSYTLRPEAAHQQGAGG